ncbi:hypothetical protein GCM10010428_09920 [Actinosynnema pretiosum subsp. pretiosum]
MIEPTPAPDAAGGRSRTATVATPPAQQAPKNGHNHPAPHQVQAQAQAQAPATQCPQARTAAQNHRPQEQQPTPQRPASPQTTAPQAASPQAASPQAVAPQTTDQPPTVQSPTAQPPTASPLMPPPPMPSVPTPQAPMSGSATPHPAPPAPRRQQDNRDGQDRQGLPGQQGDERGQRQVESEQWSAELQVPALQGDVPSGAGDSGAGVTGGGAGDGGIAAGVSDASDAGAAGDGGASGAVAGGAGAGSGEVRVGRPAHAAAESRTADDVEAGIIALWHTYGQSREQGLRDRLVLHYAPLVKYVAGRVGTGLPAHVDVADLIQSGIFGLVDAIEKFEPERGLKFETYAMQRIRGAILDDLRSQDWVPRSVRSRARDVERALERLGGRLQRTPTDRELAAELKIGLGELRELYAQFQLTSVVALDELIAAGRAAGSAGSSLAESLPDEGAEDPVASLVDQDSRRQLADAIAQLAERDRVVVTLYYFENLTLAEIGKVLGVTESRVCQLHTRAVLRLRTKINEQLET